MNMFRALRAEEIDCRISQIKKTSNGVGLSLLLYKDARCDQNILDETVGPMNWERKHSRDNANCTVSIWDEKNQRWVSKEDTGTESNTEKAKGLASDSFKRACFNWGIGRELYTAPFIWIDGKNCNIKETNGKLNCYDRFTVTGIGYTDGVITGLKIKNQKTGKICFEFGEIKQKAPEKPEQPDDEPVQPGKVQEKPAEQTNITTMNRLQSENPVKDYINNELKFMMELYGIQNKEEVKKQFMEMRKTLIQEKLIEDKPSNQQTMEEAKAMFKALYDRFRPVGESA